VIIEQGKVATNTYRSQPKLLDKHKGLMTAKILPKQIQEFLNAVRELISKDIALLQLAPSTSEFVNAAKLLKQEWDGSMLVNLESYKYVATLLGLKCASEISV
uniref:Uncharacterized protein n=1 Tax=Ditylenchus dipsaci TaxID=166011 RepID=A0A915DQ81_9BILA